MITGAARQHPNKVYVRFVAQCYRCAAIALRDQAVAASGAAGTRCDLPTFAGRGQAVPYNATVSIPELTRNLRIDLLRGVAISAVLLLHFSLTYRLADGPLAGWVPAGWIRGLVDNGNYGVTMFFAISGFLITSNNLRRYGTLRAVDLRQFYVLRFARIVPPLLFALALILPLGLLGLPSFANSVDGRSLPVAFFGVAVLSVLTFWHNVLMQTVGYFNYALNIYWSLSVEEVFYLTFPLACVLLRRRALMVALCFALIGFAPLYRGWHSDDELYFMYAYAACFDAIAFGCLAALLCATWQPGPALARALRWAGAVGVALAYLAGIDGHERFGFTLVAAFTAVALVGAVPVVEGRRGIAFRAVAWMGRHSYELYLYHIVVLGLLRDWLPRGTVPDVYKLPLLAAFLGLSALVAAGASRALAEPANAALRRRFTPPRRRASMGPPPSMP